VGFCAATIIIHARSGYSRWAFIHPAHTQVTQAVRRAKGEKMETQIDLLEETEQILLELLAQYKSNQYVPLTRAIACVRILKRSLGNATTGAADLGWECGICKSSNLQSDLVCVFCDTPRPGY